VKKGLTLLAVVALLVGVLVAPAAAGGKRIKINVLLNTEITDEILTELDGYGRITGTIESLDVVFMKATRQEVRKIRHLPFVENVSRDARRNGKPIDTVAASDFVVSYWTWDMDAIGVRDYGSVTPQVPYDGTGIYVAVLDTGLLDTWRQYFPEERIATEFAASVSGGGNERGKISWQPNKWEHDTNSHGTHVTSTILGYNFYGDPISGVAPMAKVIPVKVLNNNGSGWSSMVASGITYIANLKKDGELGTSPVVINMSLGGPALDVVEQTAIDYAIDQGVIIVASAGNNGDEADPADQHMGYPGAYEPVISVAASGWTGEWTSGGWWMADVADPTDPDDFYIVDFSAREFAGQDLDVAAPGSWVVGPYQVNRGQISYYYLGGTSMASPHVAGIVALMAQKYAGLTAPQAEAILESSAIAMADGCRNITSPYGPETVCWGTDKTGSGLADADAALAATP
jgi:subtilisin family serine protease